jgi:hypothetical protein
VTSPVAPSTCSSEGGPVPLARTTWTHAGSLARRLAHTACVPCRFCSSEFPRFRTMAGGIRAPVGRSRPRQRCWYSLTTRQIRRIHTCNTYWSIEFRIGRSCQRPTTHSRSPRRAATQHLTNQTSGCVAATERFAAVGEEEEKKLSAAR